MIRLGGLGMNGYLLIIVCNSFLYGAARWFMDAEFLKRHGTHRLFETVAAGLFFFFVFMFCQLNAAALQHSPGDPPSFAIFGVGVLTGVPWVLVFAFQIMDTASGGVDSLYGLNSNMLDKVNLKVAHEHLMKGNRREAIGELTFLKEKYRESYSPLFLLAIMAEEDKNYDKAVDMYREILQRTNDHALPWTNAAQNLADLLRQQFNDEKGAKHLEEEILVKNPDTQYKYSSTRQKPLKKVTKKRREVQNVKADINQARRLMSRGEHTEALALMKRYINENPEDSRTQFELVSLFERTERHDEAIIWLQKIIRSFNEDDKVWGEAMMRLAGIREHGEKDLEAAIGALEQIASRLKHASHGRLAREHLKDIRDRA
jgi:tetratricopeptide (TPR) repeat protein